jgi:hypothetical protein
MYLVPGHLPCPWCQYSQRSVRNSLVFYPKSHSVQSSPTVLDDWWHYSRSRRSRNGGVLCCCLTCMPPRIQDASACLVQELLCLGNRGYTILRDLLAAYHITRCHNAAGRPVSSDSCSLLRVVRVQHYTSLAFKPFFGLVRGSCWPAGVLLVMNLLGEFRVLGVCTESWPKTIFLSFGQMDRFGMETLIPLSRCLAAAVLRHLLIIIGPRYRRLEVQTEQNGVSFCPLFPGFRKSILC